MQNINNGLSILAVEDYEPDQVLLEQMIRSSDLKINVIHISGSVTDAVEILKSHSIDLVLLDLTLPDSYGIQTFLAVKPLLQGCPVIVLSGMADTALALEAIKEGAQDYLIKGEFNSSLLAKSIQYALERKRNIENLRESHERFNMVVKATNDAIWDWDLEQNQILLVGETYRQLFGYDLVDTLSPTEFWENCLHPEDRERVMTKLREIISQAKVSKWEDEFRLRKCNGEYLYVHDRGYIIYSADQRPVRIIGALQDITQRKLSEESIRTSEEKYRQTFYRNPYPTWIYDRESLRILEVNDAALEKYGYAKDDFLRLTIWDLHTEEEGDEFYHALKNGVMIQRFEQKLWRHHTNEGFPLIVEITSQMIDYFGKMSIQVIINDVTEKIRLQKELARQQKLKQQQITEVVLGAQERERFELGQELHDNINQILATSKLYLDVAIEEEPRMELLAKSRKNINMAIEEIRKLSKDLITPTLNDLGLIQSIRELIRSIQLVKKMKIVLNISGVNEDKLKPEQKINVYRIIQEQLNNIIKHAHANTVYIDLHMSKEQICLQLRDDGQGFDPRSRRDGVGISNIISRAELYNGRVEIESAPGKGCKLEVILNSKALPEQV